MSYMDLMGLVESLGVDVAYALGQLRGVSLCDEAIKTADRVRRACDALERVQEACELAQESCVVGLAEPAPQRVERWVADTRRRLAAQ